MSTKPTDCADRRGSSAVELVAVFLAVSVPIISLVAVALLVVGSFTAQRALFIGIPLSLWLARVPLLRARDETRWPARGAGWLVLVLLLAFLLRWPPSLHLQATGDPGVYMAMAGYFAKEGSLDVRDPVRERLASPDAVARFDSNNIWQNLYQPGISMEPDVPGHYIFQFYHVHPAWMAISAGLFGLNNASASQVFFGLLSILFAALLIERLTGDWRAGVVGATLFALMPLHVFFSKFPISEMPTLALAFIAMYALSRACADGSVSSQMRWLAFASAAFAGLCLTRISGFVYLPVLYAGALLSCIFIDEKGGRRRFVGFWVGLIAIYFASVAYGLIWSHPYAISLYYMHFGGSLLRRVPAILAVGAVVATIPFVLLRREALRLRVRNGLSKTWTYAQRWLPLSLVFILGAGAIRAAVLGFTDHYRGSAWYDLTWGMSHAGFDTVLRSALLITAENLGPTLAALLPFALYRPGTSAARVLLSTMVVVILGYTAVLQWFLPFQFYYSRYLLSEVVPFCVLLIVLRCADGWMRPALRFWIAAAVIAAGAYFLWFTWPLVGFREARGAEKSLARIASQLDDRSVLLVDEENLPSSSRFATPLRMWFGKNTYTLRHSEDIPAILRDLRRAGLDDVFLLRSDSIVPAPFKFLMKARFEQEVMERSPLLPRRPASESTDFVLARLDDAMFDAELLTSPDGIEPAELPSGCCTGFVPRDIWTGAHSSIQDLPLPEGTWKRLTVTMHGYRPDYASSDLVVRANGKELQRVRADGKIFQFALDSMRGPTTLDLDIYAKTFVPRELGLNDDPRSLGVDIATLRVD